MTPLIITHSVHIEAPPDKVWQVLTDPALTQQYLFGCEVESDWKIGSPILWKGAADGVVYVKGQVLKLEPERTLQCTVFNPHLGYEDTPKNYVTVTWELVPDGQHTRLEGTQGDFAVIEEGEKQYNDNLASWSIVLPKIKELAER